MVKKIFIGFVLTVCILAFPVRLLTSNEYLQAALKCGKGMLFITIILYLMYREKFLRKEITLQGIKLSKGLALIPALLLLLGYVFFTGYKHLGMLDTSWDFLMLTLAGTLIAASAEEVVFRGYMFNLLRKAHGSVLKSLILSSFLFAIAHVMNIFRYDDVWSILNQVIFAFCIGMLLGSMYVLTNNLLFVCIFHFIINVPSAIRSLTPSTEADMLIVQSSLTDNLLSTLFIVLIMLPFLILAFRYVKISEKTPKLQRVDR